MKILSLSDIVLEHIYSGQIQKRFMDVDVVLGCGDLPYYYLEFVFTMLQAPLFYVRGNHANVVEYTVAGERTGPLGGIDLHRRVVHHEGALLAGVEGSLRYREGPFQYSQAEMWGHVFRLVPAMLVNRLQYGRFLDIFISHAPPFGIHDAEDRAHRGIKAYLWLLKVFKPSYHFHGHIHVYHSGTVTKTHFYETSILNTYGYRVTELAEGGAHV